MENDLKNILPLAALKEIPKIKAGAKEIVALKKEKGRVVGYKLSSGEVISKEKGVDMAKNGEIKGVAIASKYGSLYLKSIPDGKEDNNLGNLPSIS